MTYPSEDNADAKHAEKLQKYQQLAFEIERDEELLLAAYVEVRDEWQTKLDY